MIRLQGNERLFISEDLRGFTDVLERQRTIPRMIDILFLGFSYAVKNDLDPADDYNRHSLIAAFNIDENLMLAIEATAQWYGREKGLNEPQNEAELLGLICSVGIAGARELQKRWEVRTKSQIQMDIMQMLHLNGVTQ